MSKPMKKVEARAARYDAKLFATDPRFTDSWVLVDDENGSRHLWRWAFALWWESDGRRWWAVFTEHDGYHVFSVDDVTLRQFREVDAFGEMKVAR